MASLSATLCSFTMGLMMGYSSPAIPELRGRHILSDKEGHWFGSLLLPGAVFGGIIGGFLVKTAGRKSTIIYGVLPSAVGWLFIICGLSPVTLSVGRILTGLSLGISSVSVPIYITEISSTSYRGRLVLLHQLNIVTGILVAYSLGMSENSELIAVISLLSSFLYIILMLFMPESPQWLLHHQYEERARDAMTWLRGGSVSISAEYHELKSIINEYQHKYFTFRGILEPKIYVPLIVSIGLMVGQQIGGITVVTFYVEDIFDSADIPGAIPSVIVGGLQVIFTFITIFVINLRLINRKPLLILSNVLMIVGCVTFGSYLYVYERQKTVEFNWLAVVCLSVYIVGFSVGMGPLPVLIMTEVLPINIRAISMICGMSFGWISSFLITMMFQFLNQAIGMYGMFWIFSFMSFLTIIFVVFVVVETNGKSLEELETNYGGSRESYVRI